MVTPAEGPEHPAARKLQSIFPDAFEQLSEDRGELTVEVRPDALRSLLERLREHSELRFRFLADLTAVDRFPLEPRFEIVYHLLSLENRWRLRLKTRVPGGNPSVDSIAALWPAANMLEREVFDLFGVHFRGHPNLTRILMPDEWEGHPLRKDYPVEGFR